MFSHQVFILLGIPQTHFFIYAENPIHTRARSTSVIPYCYINNMVFSRCCNLAEDCAPQFLTFSINKYIVSRISSVTTQVDKEAKKPYIPVKSLCDYKNSKDRKCVYTSAKLPILVPYPKLKNTKNEKNRTYLIIQISHFLFILIFVLILFFIFFNPPKIKKGHQR